MLWIIVALFLLLAGGLMAIPISFRINYSRQEHDDNFIVEIKLWPGISYRIVVGARKLKKSFKRPAVEYEALLEDGSGKNLAGDKEGFTFPSLSRILKMVSFWNDIYRELKPSMKYMLGKIRLKKMNWHTGLGVGNPLHTGLLTGMLWGLKGFLMSLLFHNLSYRPAKPVFSVVPYFNKKGLTIFFDCILTIRIGHIIFTGLRMAATLVISGKLMKLVKNIKEGIRGENRG